MMLSVTPGLRVARRVVGLFVVCALLPVALAIGLSYSHIQEALLAQRVGQLSDAAGSYGNTVFERLSVADVLAGSIAEDVANGRVPAQRDGISTYFRAAIKLDSPRRDVVFGTPTQALDEADIARFDEQHISGATLMVGPARGGKPGGIWVVRGSPPRRIALELEPRFLWGTIDDLPYETNVCVYARGASVYCTEALPASALDAYRQRLATGAKGDFAWEAGGIRYQSSFLELFLRGKFGADPWSIVATQPGDYALAPVRSVKQVVIPVVVLGLLAAAFLGMVQVRRTLRPLRELTDATARIAARDFSAQVPAGRDDEFGALAAAFNSMSKRLGQQFHTLEANAEIDSVILADVDLAQVTAIVLRRVSRIARSGKCALLLANPARPGDYRIHSTEDPGGCEARSVSLAEPNIRRLAAMPDGASLCVAGAPAASEFAATGMLHPFALPILIGDELAGAIVLAEDTGCPLDAESRSHLRELADRIAVALATARRDHELHRRANYDALTHLPNRLLGMEELSRAVAAASRHERRLAVLFVDLDGFSTVNDSLGHAVGDQLLVETAARLRECVRGSDVVARLGGDEFAVVLTEIREPQDAALAAGHIIDALSLPFTADGNDAFVSASIGIALYPADGGSGEELLRHADLAMYRAKENGRRQAAYFEPSMNAEAQRRLTLERELRQALAEGQFVLYYQPQLDLASGRVVGAEALIRWNHPERGLVPPAHFIAFAESSPLIEEIGRWTLEAACAQFMEWRRQGLPLDHVSVNVAPRQFRTPGLTDTVAAALAAHAMPESALRLEITESAVIDHDDGPVQANLQGLCKLGTPLELDDFGTGYSSLAYLQRLPVATVKLDRGLLQKIESDDSNRAVVRAAIDMVHALGKTVVAEGVETAGELAILGRLGCDVIQGYHLSRPVPAADFARLVTERSVTSRAQAVA